MKETKTAKASSDCPTLLHYLARVLLRTDVNLVNFIDELPHLEAAARGEFVHDRNGFPTIIFAIESVGTDTHSVGSWSVYGFEPSE